MIELLVAIVLAFVLIRYVPFAGCLIGLALAIAIPIMIAVYGISAILYALGHPTMGGLLLLLFVLAVMQRVRATRLERKRDDRTIEVEWREITPPEDRR
jgi:hypothetical protein